MHQQAVKGTQWNHDACPQTSVTINDFINVQINPWGHNGLHVSVGGGGDGRMTRFFHMHGLGPTFLRANLVSHGAC